MNNTVFWLILGALIGMATGNAQMFAQVNETLCRIEAKLDK